MYTALWVSNLNFQSIIVCLRCKSLSVRNKTRRHHGFLLSMLGYTNFVHQNVSLQQGRIETSTNYVWTKLLQDAFSDWKVLFLLSFPLDNANILLIIVSLWKPGFFSSSLDKRRFFIHDFLTASKKNWTSAAAPPPLSNHQTAPTCRQASLPNLANTRQKTILLGPYRQEPAQAAIVLFLIRPVNDHLNVAKSLKHATMASS